MPVSRARRKNGDGRGGSSDRRARRAWLVEQHGVRDGRKVRVPCNWCRKPLRPSQMTVDRWPVCGHRGGRYVRGNIVPSCMDCNIRRCKDDCGVDRGRR